MREVAVHSKSKSSANLRSLFVWLTAQGLLVVLVLFLACLILLPGEGEIQARILALREEVSGMSRVVRRLYMMRAGVGFAFPFAVIVALLGALAWSISMTIREIAECRERIGMKR